MKIIFIVGNDNHHRYLVNQINKIFPLDSLIIEKKKITNSSKFKQMRNLFEKKIFKEKNILKKSNFKSIIFTKNINNKNIANKINTITPDLIICCGISVLSKKFIDLINTKNILNLHGGNPLEYRGLDSHLWSIYHNDFKNIQVTLHFLEKKIDTGDIVIKRKINLDKVKYLHELRYFNILLCEKMVTSIINYFKKSRKIKRNPQKNKGRYYSSIPDDLVQLCEQKFNKYKHNEN